MKSGDNFLRIAEKLFGQGGAAQGAKRLARANQRVKQVKAGMVLQVPPEEVMPEAVQIGEQQPVAQGYAPFAGVTQPTPGQQLFGRATGQAPVIPMATPVGQQYEPPKYNQPGQAKPQGAQYNVQGIQNIGVQPAFQQTPYTPIGAPQAFGGSPKNIAPSEYGWYADKPYGVTAFPGWYTSADYTPVERHEAWGYVRNVADYTSEKVQSQIQQGIAPMIVPAHIAAELGIDTALLVEYGYIKDEWGNWLNPARKDAPMTPDSGDGGGGGFVNAGYSPPRRYAPATQYTPTGRQIGQTGRLIDPREIGGITWRI